MFYEELIKYVRLKLTILKQNVWRREDISYTKSYVKYVRLRLTNLWQILWRREDTDTGKNWGKNTQRV